MAVTPAHVIFCYRPTRSHIKERKMIWTSQKQVWGPLIYMILLKTWAILYIHLYTYTKFEYQA